MHRGGGYHGHGHDRDGERRDDHRDDDDHLSVGLEPDTLVAIDHNLVVVEHNLVDRMVVVGRLGTDLECWGRKQVAVALLLFRYIINYNKIRSCFDLILVLNLTIDFLLNRFYLQIIIT